MIGAGAALLVAVVVGAVMMSGSSTGSLDELAQQVEAIRTAELEYHSAFSDYVSAEAAPRAPHEVDGEAVPWKTNKGFRKLSWAPEDAEVLFGSYSVTADRNGFTVVGTADVDGDGERAIVEATADSPATAKTGPGIR
jgi:hypothetical protein